MKRLRKLFKIGLLILGLSLILNLSGAGVYGAGNQIDIGQERVTYRTSDGRIVYREVVDDEVIYRDVDGDIVVVEDEADLVVVEDEDPDVVIEGETLNLNPPGQFRNLPRSVRDVADFVSVALQILLVIAAIAFFIMLLVGGIRWILSGGDKTNTQAARGQITAALVGLVIVFSAWIIAAIIGRIFNVNIFNISIPNV
jgi:hypothetical protein